MVQVVMTDLSSESDPTRWFFRLPAGDTYYGRRFQGRTYEIVPQTQPDLQLVKGRGYVAEGALPLYPGRLLLDSDNNSVLADCGDAVMRYESTSGNLGGYGEVYYTATMRSMKASVIRGPIDVMVSLDSVAGREASEGFDRAELADLLSFVATARALIDLSQIHAQLSGPDGLPPVDEPIPTDVKAIVRVTLGRLPAEKEAGL